jgi:transaldolase
MNERLKALADAGVSIWLDDLSRERITSGNLADLVSNFSVSGVTTNPTIFAAALSQEHFYDEQIRELATTAQATDLWKVVDRPNVLIKIPATKAGLPSITTVTAEGVSVNVTLIFALERYRAVIDAYMTGLEQAAAVGHDLSKIHSVASFFVSRVDTEIDKRLEAIGSDEALALRGKAAIANARLAYALYEEEFSSERFAALEAKGANRQRPLWASTGVKNPDYSDTMYITELVVPNTVNTMPEKTMMAFADHGEVRGDMVTGTKAEAQQVLDDLERVGISYDDVVDVLEKEGVEKFEASWNELVVDVQQELDAAKAAR